MSASLFDKLKKQITSGRLSVKSIVAMFLFGAIILVFVFFGLSSKTNGMGSSGYVARVNNTLISRAELSGETQRLEQMYAPLFGGQMGGDAQRQFVQGQALENLISMELISEAAHAEGIWATDLEVRDFITRDVPIFQKDGRFQRDLYNQYLQYNKSGAGEFEDKIRKDRKNQRARRLFETVSQTTELEMKKLKSLKEQKRNVAFAKIDKEAWLHSANLPAGEVQAQLAKPEFQKKAEEYFKSNRNEFSTEAQIKASHILIKFQSGNTKSEADAMARIKSIQARLGNEDFAKVAKATSEDQGSKDKGGDLGTFGPGKMVPEFEQAAMQQKIGVVGEPVKSQFGYHLIKVMDRKAAIEPSFEQIKNQVAIRVLASEKLEAATKSLEEALVKPDAAAVDGILKELKVSWEDTGYFDLSQDSIPKLASPLVSQAAFEVSPEKPLLNRLVRESGLKYVLKLKESKVDPQANKDMALTNISREKSYDLFSQWIESTKKTAKIEKNLPATRSQE